MVAGEEGLGIREKLLLLLFVADEVTQPHGQALLHRRETCAAGRALGAEHLSQTEQADAARAVEVREPREHLRGAVRLRKRRGQLREQRTVPSAPSLVVEVAQQRPRVRVRKRRVKERAQALHIAQGERVQRVLRCLPPLTGERERVFAPDERLRKAAVPEVTLPAAAHGADDELAARRCVGGEQPLRQAPFRQAEEDQIGQ